jgi:hypothetical protein
MLKFIRLTFSENGEPSAKRVVGFLGYLVALGCIIALTIRDGGTVVVQDLIQTLLITSTSLLGLYSITSIWKRGSISVGEAPKQEKTEEEKPKDNEEKIEE